MDGKKEDIKMKFYKDFNGKIYYLDNKDKRVLEGRYIFFKDVKYIFENDVGEKLNTFSNDPKVLSGEYQKTKPKWKLTPKRCKQISERNSKMVGELNSQYGNKWIHNDILRKNKTVKKENLNKWLKNGWVIGRFKFLENI